MKTLNISDFRQQCLQLLEGLPPDGVLITKHGRPVAKVTPLFRSCSDLIGCIKDLASNPQDDLFSTGITWDAESRHTYSDQSAGRRPQAARTKRSRRRH